VLCRLLLPFASRILHGDGVISLAPIDHRSSIACIFCMSVAAPAVVSVCLVSLNSWLTNLLFEAYYLVWMALFMCLHAHEDVLSIPVIVFHNLAVLLVCLLLKPPILRLILEFSLHPVLHILSHAHHTQSGALPDGFDTEADALSTLQFQHSKCTASPWLAAFWTLLVGKKCRCHALIFDMLLIGIFGFVLSAAFVILVALHLLFGVVSLPILVYPVCCILTATVLSTPFALASYFGVVRMRKTPLCASTPISFVGIMMFLLPMLMCAWIAPIVFWTFHTLGFPLQPAFALLLMTLSSLQPYIFVRACPQAFRPAGWMLFLSVYFWSHWKLMNVLFDAELTNFYSLDASRLSLVLFVPLYAFLQSLLSRSVCFIQ
jgi:hypothetical protein